MISFRKRSRGHCEDNPLRPLRPLHARHRQPEDELKPARREAFGGVPVQHDLAQARLRVVQQLRLDFLSACYTRQPKPAGCEPTFDLEYALLHPV